MKHKNIFAILLLSLMLLLIIRSQTALEGARYGFMLWYTNLLPTLLPFMILSNLMILTGAAKKIGSFFMPDKKDSFGAACIYCIFTGFLCGYPMGAYVCGQVNLNKELSDRDATLLAGICNNVSPAFMNGYIALGCLGSSAYMGITLLSIMLPAFLLFIIYIICGRGKNSSVQPAFSTTEENPSIFSILDTSISNALFAILKLCAYVIIFSVFAFLIKELLALPSILKGILIALLEITTGIAALSALSIDLKWKLVLIYTLTAFGGISSIFQTASMVKGSGISIKKYIHVKMIISLMTFLLSILTVYVFIK